MKLLMFFEKSVPVDFNDYPHMHKLIRSLKFRVDFTKRLDELKSCCIPAASYQLLLQLISGNTIVDLENAVELRQRWGLKKFVDDRAKLTTVLKPDSGKAGEVFSINPSTLEGIVNVSANSTTKLCNDPYLFRIKQPTSTKDTYLFESKHAKDEINFNRAMQRVLPNFSEKNDNLPSYITFILPYEVSQGISKWTVFEVDNLGENLCFNSGGKAVEGSIKINKENDIYCKLKASLNLRFYLFLNLLNQIASNVEKRNFPPHVYEQLSNLFNILRKNEDGEYSMELITLIPLIKHLFINDEIDKFGEIVSEIPRYNRKNKITRNPYPDEGLRLIADLKFKESIDIKPMVNCHCPKHLERYCRIGTQ